MDVLPVGVRARLSPRSAYAARIVVLMVAVTAVGLLMGSAVMTASESARLLAADRALTESLHERTCDSWLWPTALAMSVVGWPLTFYVTFGALIVFLLLRRERALVAYFVVTGLSGGIVDTAVKEIIDRRRPMLEGCNVGLDGKSFPSGHLMIATMCYGMLLIALLPLVRTAWRRRALIAAVVVALLASMFARSAVGAHYASDLVGGLVLGALWLAAATWAFGRWRAETGHRAAGVRSGADPEAIDRLRRRDTQRQPAGSSR